jgi:hypothetical protein
MGQQIIHGPPIPRVSGGAGFAREFDGMLAIRVRKIAGLTQNDRI